MWVQKLHFYIEKNIFEAEMKYLKISKQFTLKTNEYLNKDGETVL